MRKSLQKYFGTDSGATLVEYGIALIVAIIVGGTGLSILAAEAQGNMTEAQSELPTSS